MKTIFENSLFEYFKNRFDYKLKGDYDRCFTTLPETDVYTWFESWEERIRNRFSTMKTLYFGFGMVVGWIMTLIVLGLIT